MIPKSTPISGPTPATSAHQPDPTSSTSCPPYAADPLHRDEGLKVEVEPRYGRSAFTGTAAQLIAEGLIPAGFEWPKATEWLTWEADGFDYRLMRRRPNVPDKQHRPWRTADHWQLSRSLTACPDDWQAEVQARIEEKARALEHEVWKHSSAGIRFQVSASRARRDQGFQAFLLGCLPQPAKRLSQRVGGGRHA